MTQNLRIGKLIPIKLTTADTDTDKEYLLPAVEQQLSNLGVNPQPGITPDMLVTLYVDDNPDYGGYYTFGAATLGGIGGMDGIATISICPKSWKLPTVEIYNSLINNYTHVSILQSPANFNKSGFFNGGALRNRDDFGSYWTSTADGRKENCRNETGNCNSADPCNFYIDSNGICINETANAFHPRSVRCVHV